MPFCPKCGREVSEETTHHALKPSRQVSFQRATPCYAQEIVAFREGKLDLRKPLSS